MTRMYLPREQSVGNWATLGPVVRDARTRAGLTQRDLAADAGVSRGWLIRFEGGLPNAEPVTVFRLLRALDLELVVRPRRRAGDERQDAPESLPEGAFPDDEIDLDEFMAQFTAQSGTQFCGSHDREVEQ